MTARVTSAFFVSALVRKAFGSGGAAAVLKKGAEEAGVVFVIVDRLDGTGDLYGPAPQTAFDDERPTDRLFLRIAERAAFADIDARLARERNFDPDIWVVAVEDRKGRAPVELAG